VPFIFLLKAYQISGLEGVEKSGRELDALSIFELSRFGIENGESNTSFWVFPFHP
jgi:hypothetical protein